MAPNLDSERILNPFKMVCPIWDGRNLKGQEVCPDSFYTKAPGCQSATDRVVVENYLRPQYSDFITLNAGAIQGNIYGNVSAQYESKNRMKMIDQINKQGPNYGKQLGADIRYTACAVDAYEEGMREEANTRRKLQRADRGYAAYCGNPRY